ncbi:MAG TPA: cytochrome b/b6 domain-containing protein [Verrucomicrobiae bacterium]|nr:cytochrome b/b6 domain-containing protein [Verrucomicrobiae bacterium]
MDRGRFIISALLAFLAFQLNAAALNDSDCLDCHGDNSLVKTNADGKAVSLFVNVAKLRASAHKTNSCVSCHADVTAKHPDDNIVLKPVVCAICHERQTESYNASVHGVALKAGHLDAATCQDCHDSHDIISDNSPTSPIYYTRQAETCGQCHPQEVKDWKASVHGQAMAAGKRDAPTCTDCHSEHKIESLKNSTRISEEVCSRCHASERLNTRYNLPNDRVQTFFESYHGLASQYGSTVAANCASCHGYHKILPSSDTNSTINKAHLVETCGKCHPGDTENFAFSKMHVAADGAATGSSLGDRVNRIVRQVYLTLIFVTISAMFIHNLLLFLKKTAVRKHATIRPILRMSLAQRWQHFVLAGSFIVLAITGFALKFPDSWLAKLLGGYEPFRRWAHRVAGIILLLGGLWHLIYLLSSKDGRRLVADFFPIKKDLTDMFCAVKYLCGLSRQKPQINRFGYAEKMEYWAVVWGTIIMGVTGLMIWFKMDVTLWAPRWFVDVALTIHYYEAVLACLAIIVWHFYHVIFDPDVYPLNRACIDGRVSEEWQAHEHPLEQVKPDYKQDEEDGENAP